MSLAAQTVDAAKITTFEESTDVIAALQDGQVYQPQPGDWVLLKGSAGIRMERIARFLLSPELDASRVLVRQGASWQS
jgi:UDP-N-acetylmuramyl pentapeptide synthase